MFELAWPWALLALPLPWLVWRFAPPAPPAPGAVLRVPFYGPLVAEAQRAVPSRHRLPWGRLLLWALLVMAAARPLWVGEPMALPVAGRNLLLAVDLSASMKERDMILHGRRETRLQAVKAVAGQFIARRQGDRLGLILFGSNAYPQAPLTFDRETIAVFLREAAIGLAGEATAIGDAIGLAVKRLRRQEEGRRVLILLTDGANSAGAIEPLRAAQLAASEGVVIYTIGVGADEVTSQGLFGTRRLNPGAELDEATLEAVAEATGGRYFRARDTEALEGIYRLLDDLEPATQAAETVRPRAELYPWPLGMALVGSFLLVGWRLWGQIRRGGDW